VGHGRDHGHEATDYVRQDEHGGAAAEHPSSAGSSRVTPGLGIVESRGAKRIATFSEGAPSNLPGSSQPGALP
jgi:hypothetical protein